MSAIREWGGEPEQEETIANLTSYFGGTLRRS
jgi:hypothetical protein